MKLASVTLGMGSSGQIKDPNANAAVAFVVTTFAYNVKSGKLTFLRFYIVPLMD